ncbi:MAG: aldo/keto reductase family protein [Candidatus Sericytochromatia bacterium]
MSAPIPSFLYGTAWKEERTEALTRLALENGFVGIDTANQRKHYHELGVGAAVQAFLAQGALRREQLFLQTKFTHLAGQDHRLPYDPQADFPTQVAQSFASSLEHLQTDYLDAYLLHGPSAGHGLTEGDWQVWRSMEALQRAGKTRLIGVSNVGLNHLRPLLAQADIKPAFVQNRCYARTGWDAEVRALCREHGVIYQGFSLLTANARELQHPALAEMARRHNCSVTQLVFAFAQQIGMLPLTGTSQAAHMQADLAAATLLLDAQELALIEQIGR